MKKYIKYICLFLVMLMTSVFTFSYLKADSGWDSSYDSGGSSWSSSSHSSRSKSSSRSSSSSSSSSSSNSTSTQTSAIQLVGGIMFSIWVVYFYIKYLRGGTKYTGKKRLSYMEDAYIHSVDPALDIAEFKREVFRIYKDVQIAWMNFDYEALRNLVTDEMYNMYKSQLETLKLKGQKNVMSDFSLIDVKITNITKENGLININAYLNIRMKDYVINESTKEVVRGTDKRFMNIAYNITFIKKEEAKTIENCPNCGAHIDVVSSTKCPYCDTTIVVDSNKYVMSKKTSLSQRME